MKITSTAFKSFVITSVLFVSLSDCFSQGFINLNFESAKIISDPDSLYYPYGIATTNALPGWTAFIGGSSRDQITFNAPATGSTWVSIYATNGFQISGKNSVLLQGGFYPFNPTTAAISQTGLVPLSALSLLFQAQPVQPNAGTLEVSLGGQVLNFFALSTGANYTLYGADITGFAGQTAALSFSALQNLDAYNAWNLDNIQFSSTAVPEPATLAMTLLGVALLFGRRHNS